MNPMLKKRIAELSQHQAISFVAGIRRGFEKESLRMDKQGMIALTPHPRELGSSLMHPSITTDFSESLLEFVTPPRSSIELLFKDLFELHHYTYQVLTDESLWALSMPCKLPDEKQIPIAYYGTSNIGKIKYIYRKGLGLRYGLAMQTISGVHFNFSFSDSFWQAYHNFIFHMNPNAPGRDWPINQFISEQYLAILRNGMRLGWLIPFLFGASPAVCSTFVKDREFDFLEPKGGHRSAHSRNHHAIHHDNHTLLGRYATSLRLSDLGYHNKKQTNHFISYNSLSEFVQTMKSAIHTTDPEFARFGVKVGKEWNQLSDCRLQVENEHYTWMRPKRVSTRGERMLPGIYQKGIEYLELRMLDINPFNSVGVGMETVYFLDIFLLYCLLLDSPLLTEEEDKILKQNHTQVVSQGRKPGVKLIKIDNSSGLIGTTRFTGIKGSGTTGSSSVVESLLIDWATEILDDMIGIAELLDKVYNTHLYVQALNKVMNSVRNVETLPSARMINEIESGNYSYFEYGARLSKIHEGEFKAEPMPLDRYKYYSDLAAVSLQRQTEWEEKDTMPFEEYLKRFLAF